MVDLSKGFYVQYYRCDLCDHVWSQSNLITDVAPVSVTSLRPASPEKEAKDTGAITPRTRRGRIN